MELQLVYKLKFNFTEKKKSQELPIEMYKCCFDH